MKHERYNLITYENLSRKTDGTFVVNFRGLPFHVTPDYPTAEQYGEEWTHSAIKKYAESHPNEVAAYIEPEPQTPNENELKLMRIYELESEAQTLMPYLQAGIDADINQQKLIDVLLEIEELKGNL